MAANCFVEPGLPPGVMRFTAPPALTGMTHGTGDTVRGTGSLSIAARGSRQSSHIYAANLLDISRLASYAQGRQTRPPTKCQAIPPYSPAARLRLP